MSAVVDPMKILSDPDWSKEYNFDEVSVEKKNEFLSTIFGRKRRLLELHHKYMFLVLVENRYNARRDEMIAGLTGKMNTYQLQDYFVQFFKFD